jgi:DNA replication and repair protein RecF
VLAELDPQRRADLLAHLQQIEQTLLTTTDLDLFEPSFIETTTRWNIHQGTLSSVVPQSG